MSRSVVAGKGNGVFTVCNILHNHHVGVRIITCSKFRIQDVLVRSVSLQLLSVVIINNNKNNNNNSNNKL